MAIRTVSNTGGNYTAGGTWVGGVVPTAADNVVFTATSGPLVMNVANQNCLDINFTNYTNTMTFNFALNVNGGTVNFGTGGYTIAGANANGLFLQANCNIQSNDTAWQQNISFAGTSRTYTLLDNMVVNGNILLNATTQSTINGFSLTAMTNLTHSSTALTLGTTNIILGGTGIWSHSSTGTLRNNVTINTAGTITFGTNVRFNTGTLTYTAGTVVTTASTFTMDLATTLNTNGTSILFNVLVFNGTNTILTLISDCYCNQFTMGVNPKVINGANLYNAGSLAAPSNIGNITGTSTIIMNGTGTISTTGGSYFGINITINTVGTITITTINYGIKTFKYVTAGAIVISGTLVLVQSVATLDTAGMTFVNISSGGSCDVTLVSHLTATGTLSIAQGHSLNFVSSIGFTVGGITVNGGTLILAPAPTVYTMTTNMVTTNATLAAKGLIRCALVNSTKAILNLQAGATQDNGYISATDIDSSGGISIWTYKGTLTREVNWNQLSTDPRKHVLKFGTKILKH